MHSAGPRHLVPTEELDTRLATLLEAARTGDVSAFEGFYTATIRLVMPLARRICGEGHCEDALADAYFQAWRTLDTFDASRGTALAWIKVIARSRARDRMRCERLRHAGAEGAIEHEENEVQEPGAGPEQQVQDSQLGTLVNSAVSQLPACQRMLIGLAYYGDCTHGEMASVTGLPPARIKTLMRDSHARLHTILTAPRPHGTLS